MTTVKIFREFPIQIYLFRINIIDYNFLNYIYKNNTSRGWNHLNLIRILVTTVKKFREFPIQINLFGVNIIDYNFLNYIYKNNILL